MKGKNKFLEKCRKNYQKTLEDRQKRWEKWYNDPIYSKMCWNVWYHDFNGKKIISRNIFNLNCKFAAEMWNLMEGKFDKDKTFEEELDSILMWCYWSKSEYEVVISPFAVHPEVDIKVDIYSQVKLNWEQFVCYVKSFCKKVYYQKHPDIVKSLGLEEDHFWKG